MRIARGALCLVLVSGLWSAGGDARAPAEAAAQPSLPRTFSARANSIRADASRGDLILALADGDTAAAEAEGRAGSPFGMFGLINQRAYLKSHLGTLRHLCPQVEAVAPRSLMTAGGVSFTGSERRGTGKYWIKEGDMNAETAYQDAVLVVEEVGCANAAPYAGTIYRYLMFKAE